MPDQTSSGRCPSSITGNARRRGTRGAIDNSVDCCRWIVAVAAGQRVTRRMEGSVACAGRAASPRGTARSLVGSRRSARPVVDRRAVPPSYYRRTRSDAGGTRRIGTVHAEKKLILLGRGRERESRVTAAERGGGRREERARNREDDGRGGGRGRRVGGSGQWGTRGEKFDGRGKRRRNGEWKFEGRGDGERMEKMGGSEGRGR